MCVGVPMRLLTIDGIVGEAICDEGQGLVDLSLIPDARVGDWVLTHLGTAREILDEQQAEQIKAALRGLSSLMVGGDLGDAFADLETRPPSLPPHLQAALSAGKATG